MFKARREAETPARESAELPGGDAAGMKAIVSFT